jgi:hypothetical protein
MVTIPVSRRLVAVVVALLFVLVAVPAVASEPTRDQTIGEIRRGAEEYSLVQAQSHLAVGETHFVFGLAGRGGRFLEQGRFEVWIAPDARLPARGPFTASWQRWSPQTDSPAGRLPVPGFFSVDLVAEEPGTAVVLVSGTRKGRRVAATATISVEASPPAALGTPALSQATPVAFAPEDAARIDTRVPPAPMHSISLDEALRSGRPTVLVFATPLLCTSRMCGPVVDEVLTVMARVGSDRANFVDVEIYPERDRKRPSPLFLDWGFDTEPWVLVIDSDGVIRARFEGPVVAPEIETVLTPLLPTP